MTQPIDLDSEAARLLKEADWLWSDAELAFVERVDVLAILEFRIQEGEESKLRGILN
jgi:hypothetical protein